MIAAGMYLTLVSIVPVLYIFVCCKSLSKTYCSTAAGALLRIASADDAAPWLGS